MNSSSSPILLSTDNPPPVRIFNPRGTAPFLLIGDHAGNAVPATLRSLGVAAEDMTRHIAWDIGTAGLGEHLSRALDAVFIHQAYSRLVIDCNRDPLAPDAVPTVSDGTRVPENFELTPADRVARARAIHEPYQAVIAAELARRDARGQDTILISLHSFTPIMQDVTRPWEIGVLHSEGDTRFARALLRLLQARGDLAVGDNQPYAMDGTDYTVPRHAFGARRRYAEIEIRQDLLTTDDSQGHWSKLLAEVLVTAASTCPPLE